MQQFTRAPKPEHSRTSNVEGRTPTRSTFARRSTLHYRRVASSPHSLVILLAVLCLALTAQADVIVPTNSVWRLFRGTNEASSPTGAEWRTNTFDDSLWEIAQAPFWFGTNYNPTNGTLLSEMQSNYTSVMLRRTFVVPPGAIVIGMSNRAYADDGFIAWVNGVEVIRRQMYTGTPGPFMPYTTNASATASANAWLNSNIYTNQVRTGTNVLALQVFNVSITDTDFFANPEFALVFADTSPPSLVSTLPIPGTTLTNFSQLAVTFNEAVTNARR